ncbi:helitron_like_N domain-containing protein [Trichonephila clavipes]|nr:helitron_like_N domain-containing protein [Trichonephila clavipes]
MEKEIVYWKQEIVQSAKIDDTHRSYDALQYPLMFWQGDDGYHFQLRQRNPSTGAFTERKVTAMDFYTYRIMYRASGFNIILRSNDLFQQYIVGMFAKIESEHLRYIQCNQTKLRVERCIHLRDAVVSEGNVSDAGQWIILPSSFTGSPRYMHERTQDAMTYV